MTFDWPLKTIADCAAPEPYSTQIGPFGKALTPEDYTSSGVPLLRGVNVNQGRFYDDGYVFVSEETADRFTKFESFPGDVLLVHKGTLGRIGLMPVQRKYHRYLMGNSMLRVKCNKRMLLPEYLYYWLSSSQGQHYLFSRVSQVGVPQLQTPLTTLRQAVLPVPPVATQYEMVRVLQALDDKIDLNRQMNETLEAIARAIFQSWFVDFDPVRAKIDGHPPLNLDSETAALFPNSFVDTDTGTVPEGWKLVNLPEAIEVNPSRRLAAGETAPYLDMQSMPTTSHRADEWIDRPFGSGMRFRNGDTLVARITPCLENGKTAFVDFLQEGQIGWGSTEYIVLRPRPPLPVEYAYYLARTEEFRTFAIRNMSGTSGRQRVPSTSFDRFPVVVPSDGVARAFGDHVRPLMSMIRHNSEQSRTLSALRDALLPQLLSGEIRVGQAETLLENAI